MGQKRPRSKSASIYSTVNLGASWAIVTGLTVKCDKDGWYYGCCTGTVGVTTSADEASLSLSKNDATQFILSSPQHFFSVSGNYYGFSVSSKEAFYLKKGETLNLIAIENAGACTIYASTGDQKATPTLTLRRA